jgi:hypothetical protein
MTLSFKLAGLASILVLSACAEHSERRVPPAWRDHNARPTRFGADRRTQGDAGVLNHGVGDENNGGFSTQPDPAPTPSYGRPVR